MTTARIEQMKVELMSDLADLVRTGDITDMQANEWFNMKVEQWKEGV